MVAAPARGLDSQLDDSIRIGPRCRWCPRAALPWAADLVALSSSQTLGCGTKLANFTARADAMVQNADILRIRACSGSVVLPFTSSAANNSAGRVGGVMRSTVRSLGVVGFVIACVFTLGWSTPLATLVQLLGTTALIMGGTQHPLINPSDRLPDVDGQPDLRILGERTRRRSTACPPAMSGTR